MELPQFIYGTAWKEDKTQGLVKLALDAGFTAFDTANQKKHYREDFAGLAFKDYISSGGKREKLFLQSKFTYQGGQDHRLPYDPQSPLSRQVKDSFESTLKNLHTEYLDSYLVHGPLSQRLWSAEDWEVWKTMEEIRIQGRTKLIGVSNVGLHHLEALVDGAKIPPTIVQNRCYAETGWDYEVREFCRANDILYQGFSILTANFPYITGPKVTAMAEHHKKTIPQVVFRFASQVGMIPLTGTSDKTHMSEDLECFDFKLSNEELRQIEMIALH